MRIPSFLRRTPTFEDVASHLRSMPSEQVQYMSMLSKSGFSSSDFLSAVKTSSSDGRAFLKLSTDDQLKTVSNAAVVHACVTTISSAFQEAPLVLEEREEDGTWKRSKEQIPSQLKAMKNNPDLSESEIKQIAVMNLLLTGTSFMWLLRDGTGEVKEVWPIPSSWVKIHLNSNFRDDKSGSRLIEGYSVSIKNSPSSGGFEGGSVGSSFTVYPSDMIYTKFPAPWSLVEGMSPLDACTGYIGLEQQGYNYTSNSLENLNLPGIVIKTDRQMSNTQKKMLRASLADKIGAKAARSALAFSGKDLTVDMVNPLDSFGWSDFHKLNETRICMSFKVPPIVIGALVGLEETTGWASGDMREAKKWLYRNTVHGIWNMFSENLTRQFIEEDDRERFRISFDPNQVPELQEERKVLEERAVNLFNASVVTLNEAREMMLMPSTEGGDLFKTNLSNMYVPTGDLGGMLIPGTPDGVNMGTEQEDEILEIDNGEAENEGK